MSEKENHVDLTKEENFLPKSLVADRNQKLHNGDLDAHAFCTNYAGKRYDIIVFHEVGEKIEAPFIKEIIDGFFPKDNKPLFVQDQNFVSVKNNGRDFGSAINALKNGYKVAREGWNGKGMFLFLLPAGTIPKTAIHDSKLKEILESNGKDHFEALGSIRMKTADDKILTGWLASQTDMLADDWIVIE